VNVKLDPSWHLPGDTHPNSRGAQAIAIAVAERLRADGLPLGRARPGLVSSDAFDRRSGSK